MPYLYLFLHLNVEIGAFIEFDICFAQKYQTLCKNYCLLVGLN
jgi:hypothetical protein